MSAAESRVTDEQIAVQREQALTRLETLPPDERALELPKVAKTLGVTVSAMKDALRERAKAAAVESKQRADTPIVETIDPWPTEVNLGDVLTRIESEIRRYIVLEERYVRLAALWVVHTFLIDYLNVSPYLLITAGDMGCGKSTLQEVLRCLSFRSYMGSMPSEAVTFRLIAGHKPTLFIDETDNLFRNPEASAGLTAVLNVGNTRQTGRVPRCEKAGDNFEIRSFSCFGAKCLSGIGRCTPDTVTSRSLRIVMRRALRSERRESIYRQDAERDARHLETRRMALRWAVDNAKIVVAHEPQRHEFLANRAEQIWGPLLTVAELAGGEWSARAVETARLIQSEAAEVVSKNDEFVADVINVFQNAGADSEGFLPTSEIVKGLCAIEDGRWASYDLRRGGAITPRQLAGLMAEVFNVQRTTQRYKGQPMKGYLWSAIRETAERLQSSAVPLEIGNSGNSVTVTSAVTKFSNDNQNVSHVTDVPQFGSMEMVLPVKNGNSPLGEGSTLSILPDWRAILAMPGNTQANVAGQLAVAERATGSALGALRAIGFRVGLNPIKSHALPQVTVKHAHSAVFDGEAVREFMNATSHRRITEVRAALLAEANGNQTSIPAIADHHETN